MANEVEAVLEDAAPSRMAEFNVPGCAFAVIEHGEVRTVRCFGVADASTGNPVTPKTRFSLQSVLKSMAGWAVMTLVEQRRLDLDAPISRYLRRWSLPASDAFDLSLVTPRRLLSHHAGVTTAGLRGVELNRTEYTLLDALDARLPAPTEAQKRHWAYWNLPEIEPVSVTHPPGEGWRYSNAGFALLEIAVEDITGQSYATFVDDAIFRPLGMRDAGFGIDPSKPHASPHDRDGRPAADHLWLSGAAAGVYATIEDLGVFACAAMDGGSGETAGRGVLHRDSLELMFTSHGAADQSGGLPFEAGLGHVLLRDGGLLNVHHSGGSIGWRSVFSIYPETGSGLCMLMNGEAANDLWVPLMRQWRDFEMGRRR